MSFSAAEATPGAGPDRRGENRGRALSLRWYGRPRPPVPVAPVVATGVFDVLHPGHVRFLAWAAAKARPLYVGVEDDARVAHWKGPGRPVHTATERAEVLAALRPVSMVFYILGDPAACGPDDYVDLLRPIGAAALAFTAGDPHTEAKRAGAAALGAECWEFPFQAGHSSSAVLARAGLMPRDGESGGPTKST
jgi:cytidyltransferase-like protein